MIMNPCGLQYFLKKSVMKGERAVLLAVRTAALVIILAGASLTAQWQDDFESYWAGWNLPSPWQSSSNITPVNGSGYGGGKAVTYQTSGWDWGDAWRPMDSDSNVVFARFYADSVSTYQGAKISLSATKSTTVDSVSIYMYDPPDLEHGKGLILIAQDYDGSGDYQMDNRIRVMNLSQDTWYDVQIILNDAHTEAKGQYRPSGSEDWITIGSVEAYDGFSADYVGIHSSRYGYIDDVGCRPYDDNEPYLVADVLRLGNVGTSNLEEFIAHWLSTGEGISVDFSGSGKVDFLDYAMFGAYWLACTDNTSCWGSLMHIADMSSRFRTGGCGTGQWYDEITVTVQDRNGNPVAGAKVDVSFAEEVPPPWNDDFESYPSSWDAIPAPWETGDGEYACYVQPNIGYGPSKGVGGPSNWDWGYQYRPTDDSVTQLCGRVYAASGQTWSNAYISLIGSKNHTADRVSIGLQSEGEHDITLIVIAATSGDDNRHQISGLSEDTWYDVRLTQAGSDWLGEYREAGSSVWLSAGTVTPYSNFDDTYVGMAAQRGGSIDDITYSKGGGASLGSNTGITDADGKAVVSSDCHGGGVVTVATVDRISASDKYYDFEMNKRNWVYSFGPEEANQPLLVCFSQTTPDATIFRDSIAYFEDYLPFDGTVIHIHKNSYMGRFGDIRYTDLPPSYWDLGYEVFYTNITPNYNDYNKTAVDMQAANFEKFNHNFINMDVTGQGWFAMNWFDDTLWDSILDNARLLARIAYESGCDGIFFDTEQYGPVTFWNYEYLKDTYPDNPSTFAQWHNEVYIRGRQLIDALESEFPNIKLLLSQSVEAIHADLAGGSTAAAMNAYYPPLDEGVDFYADNRSALIAPFVEGLLKNRSGSTEIIDGYESSYYYKDEWEFQVGADLIRDRFKAYFVQRDLYTDNIKVGFGLYHSSLRHDGVFSPADAGDALKWAMKYTDRYVWIWSETRTYWIKGGPTGEPLEPPFAMTDSSEPADLTTPGTEENAMRARFYGIPEQYIDAYFDGKAESLK